MILTDDNFGTIVKAVELGRALYDNLLRYIRFQIAVLFGFIGTFLGASLFNILGGIPFLPLQTLWINFTVDVSQAIGLGWSKPRSGLMERPPRPRDQPMLSRRLNVWLIFCGIVMAIGTLAVIAWADATFDTETGHTMGLVTFSIFHLFFSLETADPERTIFSSELIDNPMLLKTTGVSIVTILLATQFGPLQRVLDTVELTVGQWALCVAVAASIVVICEVKKALHIRTGEEPELEQDATAAA
jgi:Ca2+-transporting ATPase